MTVVEQIVKKSISGVIVYESKSFIAFMTHEPFNPGHVLICPKAHCPSLLDVPDIVHEEIMKVAKEYYARLTSKYQPDGISLMLNNGKFNELDHYHLHIFPRYDNDGFGWTYNYEGILPQEKLREDAEGLMVESLDSNERSS